MKKQCCGMVVLVSALSAGCLAQSDGPSLGELARKNKAEKKAVMVFNDENTQRTVSTASDSSSRSSAPGTNTDAKRAQAGASGAEKKGETKSPTSASGEDKISRLQKELDSLKQQQSVWSNSAKDYEEKLANETSDFRRQVYEEALRNDTTNVKLYQKKIDQAQEELAKAQQGANKPASSASPQGNP